MGLTASYQSILNTSLSCARSLATSTGLYNTNASNGFSSADAVYSSAAAVSGSLTIDLSGDLLDVLGDPMIMSTIDFIRLKNTSSLPVDCASALLRVLGGASAIPVLSCATAFIQIKPGHAMDFLSATGGMSISDTVNDKIILEGTTSFEVVVIGRA